MAASVFLIRSAAGSLLAATFTACLLLLGTTGFYSDPAQSEPTRGEDIAPSSSPPSSSIDPVTDWYDADDEYVRIAVVEDGVYAVSRSALEAAGLPASVDAASFRMFENGAEIPIEIRPSGEVVFVGQRNRGTDELYAYDGRAEYQSSAHRSLYSDTTYYWLTWGEGTGRRFAQPESSSPIATVQEVRDTLRAEQDRTFHFGRSFESEHPLYRLGEGYYWKSFRHNRTNPITFETTLDVGRRVPSSSENLSLRVKLTSASASCHRVEMEAALLNGGGTSFEQVDVVEWSGYEFQNLTASISQDRIPATGLRIRLRSTNDTFSDSSCPDPARNPNYVYLDYAEAVYTRSLEDADGQQRFPAPSTETTSFELTGYGPSPVRVYQPAGARRFTVTPSSGVATVVDTPPRRGAEYWAVTAYRSPAAVLSETTSNWSDPSANGADYVILTTKALEPTAEDLASYRQSQNGFDVAVVNIQDVYDEFDYGRPTPIAVRRFVQAMQNWSGGAPQFLTIWGDAQYPIYTDGEIDVRRPEWNVSSFGYPPSDGWFAMQAGGDDDWTETIAVGRVPIRSNEQGRIFLDKLTTYEAAPRARWQQRMLLLAGGTSLLEQNRLQDYSNRWGEIATRRTTAVGDTLYPAGMDSIRFYKSVNDPLDVSFQDSLALDIEEGVAWLNYFGHSAAQTWEIVTDPPSEFNNAGRLPVIVSLGCRTGSFAGGRYEVRSLPSLGEQLVVGTVDASGAVKAGAENGGIAHWGSSALGNLRPSGILNDALIDQVFRDTVRVLGTAIRNAKADVEASNGNSATIVRHLLQYGLLGDPATRMVLPDRPDFHLDQNLVRTSPDAPTPTSRIDLDVQLQNRGLVPNDSLSLSVEWEQPDGSVRREDRRLPRFALERTERFSFSLDETVVGTNAFRVTADTRNEYDEILESDNQATRETIVFSEGLELIAPRPSGVVGTRTPRLRANVIRQTADPVPVEVQLDTVRSFDSGALQTASLTATGPVLDWTPSSLDDDQTYFWRAQVASTSASWKQSRFTVRTMQPAQWEQSDPFFAENTRDDLLYDGRTWTLAPFQIEVSAYGLRSSSGTNYAFNVGGSDSYEQFPFGFGVLVMDGVTGEVKATTSFATYDVQAVSEPFAPNGDGQEAIDAMRTFFDTRVEPGDYVFMQTRHLGRVSGPTIPEEVVDLIENLGSTPRPAGLAPYSEAIDTLTYNDTWAMGTRKGNPGQTTEKILEAGEDQEIRQIEVRKTPSFRRPSGTTVTPVIGPATDWSELRWSATAPSSTGTVAIEVLAPDSTRLLGPFAAEDGTAALDAIDPAAHPFVRLRATLRDAEQREAPQLDRWSLAFTGTPELAVDPVPLQAIADTLQEGSTIDASVDVLNLGSIPAAPVYITYSWTDTDNNTEVVSRDTLSTIAPEGRTTSRARISTRGRTGDNLLNVTATAAPPEPFTFNNTALRNLSVRGDLAAPRLRVLSEGRELPATENADDLNLKDKRLPFVSVQPTIEIHIEDESEFFPIDDTSYVDVYLREGLPLSTVGFLSDYQQIPFGSGELSFQPANPSQSNANEAVVTYTPNFAGRDSTYTLRIEAKDGSGNEIEPYEVSFRVQTQQVIRDVYPYPNPMSERTTFAFRVEGGRTEQLRDFRLRIYTVAGRLIREFTSTDLETGALRVGWNLLPWDGRDADGDRVATGVYLYRVSVEGGDGTFTGDVEKVAVIR